jgi:hypothetical protein
MKRQAHSAILLLGGRGEESSDFESEEHVNVLVKPFRTLAERFAPLHALI